jgi:hypothetical protein
LLKLKHIYIILELVALIVGTLLTFKAIFSDTFIWFIIYGTLSFVVWEAEDELYHLNIKIKEDGENIEKK